MDGLRHVTLQGGMEPRKSFSWRGTEAGNDCNQGATIRVPQSGCHNQGATIRAPTSEYDQTLLI